MKKLVILGTALLMTTAVAFAFQTKNGEAGKKAGTEKCEKHCSDKPCCDKPCKKGDKHSGSNSAQREKAAKSKQAVG